MILDIPQTKSRKRRDKTFELEGCPGITCQARMTFDLPQSKPSNGTSTHNGEQLCKFILKSIQNCTCYDPDRNLTFKSDPDLEPTSTNVSTSTSTRDGEQLCQII